MRLRGVGMGEAMGAWYSPVKKVAKKVAGGAKRVATVTGKTVVKGAKLTGKGALLLHRKVGCSGPGLAATAAGLQASAGVPFPIALAMAKAF